jgi:hypothetical protein
MPSANNEILSGRLRWTGGWRNIYGDAAKALGYQCRWGNGDLLILKENGEKIAHAKPKGPQFFMRDLIAQALKTKRANALWKKQQEQSRLLRLSKAPEENKGLRRGNGMRLSNAVAMAALMGGLMTYYPPGGGPKDR